MSHGKKKLSNDRLLGEYIMMQGKITRQTSNREAISYFKQDEKVSRHTVNNWTRPLHVSMQMIQTKIVTLRLMQMMQTKTIMVAKWNEYSILASLSFVS